MKLRSVSEKVRNDYVKDLETYCPPIKPGFKTTKLEWIDNSRNSLEKILNSYKQIDPQTEVKNKDFEYLFRVTGHEETESNKKGELTGWLAEPLSENGRKRAAEQEADHNSLVLSSDLPRAIEHAIIKYYHQNKTIMEKLKKITFKVQKETNNQKEVTKETHLELINLALENGIIPTPLLRAQYFGDLELFIEKDHKKDKDDPELRKKLNKEIEENKQKTLISEGKTKEEADEIIKELKKKSKDRSDITLIPRNKSGETNAENYLMFYNRSAHNVFELLEDNHFKNVDIVGHSGFFDIAGAYFRHKKDKKELHIVRTSTPKKRGQKLELKLDEEHIYLNDPMDLEIIKDHTQEKIDNIKERSIDELIKEKNEGILETPLLIFKLKENSNSEYIPTPEKLENVLAKMCLEKPEPIIIFGHGGQGKSILATEIARKFLENKIGHDKDDKDNEKTIKGEKYSKYVPIILDGQEIYEQAEINKNTKIEDETKKYGLEKILNKEIKKAKIHDLLKQEYKFVYIIDDYQKLSTTFNQEFDKTIEKIKNEGNLVILLSRLERSDTQPPNKEGYITMQIDEKSVAEQSYSFALFRFIEEEKEKLRKESAAIKDDKEIEKLAKEHAERKANEFEDYLKQYDTSISGFYLTKLFLLKLFEAKNKKQGVLDYIINPLIVEKIKNGELLSKVELYEAHTNYVNSKSIIDNNKGKKYEENPDALKDEIIKLDKQLAEKAFRDVYGLDTLADGIKKKT